MIDSMLWSFLCLWTLFSFSLFQWKFSSYFPFLMGWKKTFVCCHWIYIFYVYFSSLSKRPWRTSGTLFSYLHRRYYLILKHLSRVASSGFLLLVVYNNFIFFIFYNLIDITLQNTDRSAKLPYDFNYWVWHRVSDV